MAIAINSTNFPDDAFRSYVKDNIAKGKSSLTDNMRVSELYISNLGIHNLKGIEYLINPDETTFSLDIGGNHIYYYDFDALQAKFDTINFNYFNEVQYCKFSASEITKTNDTQYPFQFNLKKYFPDDAIVTTDIIIYGTNTNGTGALYSPVSGDSYKIENGILKINTDIRYIEFIHYFESIGRFRVWMKRDPAIQPDFLYVRGDKKIYNINDSVSLKTDVLKEDYDPYHPTLTYMNTTLPVTWSVVEGKLPPGLALNPDTGEISGVIL